MFRCQECGNNTTGTSEVKVLESRDREYKQYFVQQLESKTMQLLSQEQVDNIGEEIFRADYKVLNVKTTKGTEIIREIRVCSTCFNKK